MSGTDELVTLLTSKGFKVTHHETTIEDTTLYFERIQTAVDVFELTAIYASKQGNMPVLTLRGPLSDAPGIPASLTWVHKDEESVLKAWQVLANTEGGRRV